MVDAVAQRMNEADTCRRFVVPKLQAAGWDNDPHAGTKELKLLTADGAENADGEERQNYIAAKERRTRIENRGPL